MHKKNFKLNFNHPMKDVLWRHCVIESDIPADLLKRYYVELKALEKTPEFDTFIKNSWQWFYENGVDYQVLRGKLVNTLLKRILEHPEEI